MIEEKIVKNLKNKEDKNWPQLVANLPWGHNVLLMEKIKDRNIREIYAKAIMDKGKICYTIITNKRRNLCQKT